MFGLGLTGRVKYTMVTAAALAFALALSMALSSAFSSSLVNSSDASDVKPDVTASAAASTDGNVVTVPAAQGPRESTQSRNSSTRSNSQKPAQRRTFGFHYLDILEWLFADKRDSATPSQPRNPSSTFSG